VPRRIAVTGTRGKSAVTRLIASGLRASGVRVLAKTTGSRPVLIDPDGSEREILRAGPASIREQIRLVGQAAAERAEVLVTEMMSIGPECLESESRRILRPGTLAVTNVRLDHLDEMGRDRAGIARALASAFPERADIFIPEEEIRPVFEETAARTGSRLRAVGRGSPGDSSGPGSRLPLGEFEANRRLARAVLESQGLDAGTIERGLSSAAPDPGSLRLWRAAFGDPPREVLCVSLFAANEPESSAAALDDVRAAVPFEERPVVAVLSLREDRGDRTLQWVRAAREGFFRQFSSVVLIGPPAGAALRKIRRHSGPCGPAYSAFEWRSPEDLMDRVAALTPSGAVVVGLGNFVGPGESLARFWEQRGDRA